MSDIIPSAEELIEVIDTGNINSNSFKLGTVAELFATLNTAKVKFDGEETAAEKQFAYLSSYTPAVNDRVLLASIGGTYIILGKIKYNVSAGGPMVVSELSVTTKVGFYGTAPRTKVSIGSMNSLVTTDSADSTYSSNEVTMLGHIKSDLGSLRSKVNEIVSLLVAYGLG